VGLPQGATPDPGLWADQYVADAGSTPLLPDGTVAELVRRAHQGDDTAAETVARAYRRLVVAIAKRYAQPAVTGDVVLAGLDRDPTALAVRRRMARLIPLGDAGLRTAVEKFDPSKGFRFSTYATWHIRQAITRGLSGGASGGSGDRYPRRPLPSSGTGSAGLALPVGPA